MPSLCLEAVRFHYEDPYCPVFDDATLELDTAWRTGLIGRNGLGKSTLIGLIAGELVPYAGRVRCPLPTTRFPAQIADPRADTLAVVRECVAPFAAWRSEMDALVEAGDPASLDRYGAIALELERHDGYRVDERIEQEWSRMGLAPDRLGAAFDSLSGGEQTHALMVALFLGPPRFALIDEPTNHLDAAGRARLGDYLADKSGFLLVSHDRAFLDRCVDHVVALEGVARQPGALRVMETDYSGYREQRRRERGFADRERERLEREVRDLDAAARKRRGWSDRREKQKNTGHADRGYEGRRAAKLMKRALHVEQRAHDKLDEKRALLHRPEKSRVLKLESKAGDRATLIVADRLSVRAGARTLVADFSLRVRRGDRIAFVGANGCGKTWLLDVLARDRAPSGGSVSHPRPVSIARSHQHPRFASGRPFLDADFLLHSETARRIYHEVAADLPIIDYHSHLPPADG